MTTHAATRNVAAVDLGAESGRVLLARWTSRGLALEEVHRFANRPVTVRGHLLWDVLGLWEETLVGLRKARALAGTLDSVGVDTWGVDYALVDDRGLPLGLPHAYRDRRTDGAMARVFARIPREAVYARTGVQFQPFNTLYQLACEPRPLLDAAHRLLLLPDLFHSWLSGELVGERTNATTTQLWDAGAEGWSAELAAAIGLPTRLLPPVVGPGTVLGPLLSDLRDALGSDAQVIAPATHDTGSAIAAIPAVSADGWAYISSGTWSLVGLELPAPHVSPAALAANFTNEGGVFGTTRFLANVMGLWLLQSCRRSWAARGRAYGYDELVALAEASPAFAGPALDPDDPAFLAPDDMAVAIDTWLAVRGAAPVSADPGATARRVFESLVLRYREALETATALTGRGQGTPGALRAVHVVGGGARNRLLNQWLADATGLPVVAGPAEATGLGNALLQLVGLGEISSLADVRMAAALAAEPETYRPDPGARAAWDDAYGRFRAAKASRQAEAPMEAAREGR